MNWNLGCALCSTFISIPGARESISSKNKMHGADFRARSNSSLTFLSDSPTYMSKSSGPLTEIKDMPHSVAIALATNVLPVPTVVNNIFSVSIQ